MGMYFVEYEAFCIDISEFVVIFRYFYFLQFGLVFLEFILVGEK